MPATLLRVGATWINVRWGIDSRIRSNSDKADCTLIYSYHAALLTALNHQLRYGGSKVAYGCEGRASARGDQCCMRVRELDRFSVRGLADLILNRRRGLLPRDESPTGR